MDNFKFNFLSRGQLESLNLDRIFLGPDYMRPVGTLTGAIQTGAIKFT